MIFLGIDCGTQSTKTIALDDADGRILATATKHYDVIPNLPAGHMEQHPSTWIAALEETVAQVLSSLATRRREVAGIGVSGQQHGFVPLDENANVIRPAKLWCDTSTNEECEILRAHFGGSQFFIDRIGSDILPGYTAPKILWLKRHEPENFAKLKTVLLPHDYLNFYLTGKFRMEYGDASGTALLDVRERKWCSEIVEFIDHALGEKLPEVASSLTAIGTLRSQLAERWGISCEIVVSAGGGDNMMGAIGTANVANGQVTVSLGTSGTIYAFSDSPKIDPLGEIAGFCDSTDAWLPLVCTMNVTVATEAMRNLLGVSHDQFDSLVKSVPAGAGGLLFLPYLNGERTPNLPNGTGVFHGLTPRTMTAPHMARAVMEGVTLGLAYGLEQMRELGIAPREIRLTGGGSKSPAWRQICADIFQCRVITLLETESAALGAAIQAKMAVSGEPIRDLCARYVRVNEDEAAEPNPHLDFNYSAAQKKFNALTTTLANHHLL